MADERKRRPLMHDPLGMQDIAGVTVAQHHALCLGLLAKCYIHVPRHLKIAIIEGVQAAKDMGADIDPSSLKKGVGLAAMNQ